MAGELLLVTPSFEIPSFRFRRAATLRGVTA